MEKLIIVAGSPNSGKTLSVNMAIKKLHIKGANIVKYLFGSSTNFWERKGGGAAIVSFNGKRIAIMSYGDTVASVDEVLTNADVLSCDIIICCSHATRGKKVFKYFHSYIKGLDLSTTKIIPIYKNLLCGYGNETLENDYTSNLILELL